MDSVEYSSLDDHLWALILCPGQGGTGWVYGKGGRSWDFEKPGGVWTHDAADWLFHSEAEVKELGVSQGGRQPQTKGENTDLIFRESNPRRWIVIRS